MLRALMSCVAVFALGCGGSDDARDAGFDTGVDDVADAGIDAGLELGCPPELGAPAPVTESQVGSTIVIEGTVVFPTNTAIVAPRECEPLGEGLRALHVAPDEVTPANELVAIRKDDGRAFPCGCDLAEEPRCASLGLEEGVRVRARGVLSRRVTADCRMVACYEMTLDALCRPAP